MDYFVSTNHYKDISKQGYGCCFIKYLMILTLFSLGALPLYAQNPSAEIFVDPSNRDYPLRLTIATNARKDIASMSVRATDPTNIVAFEVDTNNYFVYPIGESGMGVRAANDTNFLPTGSNITLARFLTDSTTRQQTFTVDFLNRNGESVASQKVNVGIAASVTLAPPCNRQVLDFSTGKGIFPPWQFGSGGGLGGSMNNNPPVAQDLNWTYSPYPYSAATAIPAYAFNSPVNQQNGAYWLRPGDDGRKYAYRRYFCANNASTAVLKFSALVDGAASISVNGVSPSPPATLFVGYNPPFVNFSYNVNIVSGSNYIEVIFQDTPNNPAGFILADAVIQTPTGVLGLTSDACCKPKGRIYGWKNWDKNCNGIKDNGDAPLSGWVITATPTAGGTPVTATTDGSGFYSMSLFEGTYTITETLQSGWSPSVSAGPYSVSVVSGQSISRSFLNCKQPTCEELFTEQNSDSVCCTGRFSISNAGNTVVTQLSFSVTGGVLTGVNTGCMATGSPNMTAGLSSGTFTFIPGCANMAVQFDAKSTTATGKVCVLWTATFKQGTQTFNCSKTICVNCIRMPKDCKVPLQVTPDAFPPINTDSRTFTINNVKLPASQISSVDVLFVNEPTPSHIGGGLFVDGTSRNWTFANSGAYNRVRMNCSGTSNPHGAAANNWVKFNLGVDNTINYSGVILVKIGYCDGDTCFTEYQWKAKSIKNLPNTIDSAIAIKTPRLLRFKVISPDSTRSIGIKVGDSLATIRAVTAPCASLDNDCPDIPKQFRAVTKGNTAHLTFGSGVCKPDPDCYCCPPSDFTITVLYTPGSDKSDPRVPIKLSFFDENAVEIGQAERELTSTPTSVVNNNDGNSSSNEVRVKSISPNPSSENSVLRYALDEASSSVNITLVDMQGRVISTLLNNQRIDAGEHTLPFNTTSLTNGVYILRITADGIVVSSKFTVIR